MCLGIKSTRGGLVIGDVVNLISLSNAYETSKMPIYMYVKVLSKVVNKWRQLFLNVGHKVPYAGSVSRRKTGKEKKQAR